MIRNGLHVALFILAASAVVAAQTDAPVVTMRVTLPDGRTEDLTAPESGIATLRLADGTEYNFRPTIQDSSPWNQLVVTIFRAATANAPTQILGEVELTRGGRAVRSKTSPSFRVAVSKVDPPATQTRSTS